VSVALTVVDGQVTVEVVDDGVGIDGADHRSGLGNLDERARLHGGTFSVDSDAGQTCLRWNGRLSEGSGKDT
jgi:signal transduction histidine kinase